MSQDLKNLIIFGPQASGKSTQSAVLADFLGIKILSTGTILRQAIMTNTDSGQKIGQYVNQGILIPDELMNSLVFEELAKPSYKNGFLLDGFPRNISQAKVLDDKYDIDRVICINISDEEAIKRISGRRSCLAGHVFNVIYNPPQQEGICDICGQPLRQRQDDQEAIIKKRLAIYHQEADDLVAYYKKQAKLVVFDGAKPIEQVSADILNYLKTNAG